jgi:hypothetical protein
MNAKQVNTAPIMACARSMAAKSLDVSKTNAMGHGRFVVATGTHVEHRIASCTNIQISRNIAKLTSVDIWVVRKRLQTTLHQMPFAQYIVAGHFPMAAIEIPTASDAGVMEPTLTLDVYIARVVPVQRLDALRRRASSIRRTTLLVGMQQTSLSVPRMQATA